MTSFPSDLQVIQTQVAELPGQLEALKKQLAPPAFTSERERLAESLRNALTYQERRPGNDLRSIAEIRAELETILRRN